MSAEQQPLIPGNQPPGDARAPQTSGEQSPRDAELVVEFVKGRNVRCPTCSYNLRDAPSARCPECGSSLRLTLYGIERRPWGHSVAMWGLGLGLLSSVVLMFVGFVDAGAPALLTGLSMSIASSVLLWLVDSRFWVYWGKYAERRTTLVLVCWAPLAIVVAAAAIMYAF